MATRTTAQRTNVGTNGIRAMHVRLNDTASFPKKGREQTKTKNTKQQNETRANPTNPTNPTRSFKKVRRTVLVGWCISHQ